MPLLCKKWSAKYRRLVRQEYYWKCRSLFNSKTLCYPKRLKMKSERSAQGAGEVWGQKNNTDWEYFGEGICGRGRTAVGLPRSLTPSQKFDGVQRHLSKIGLGLFLLLLVSNLTTAAVNLPSTVKTLQKINSVIVLTPAHCWALGSRIVSTRKLVKSKSQ